MVALVFADPAFENFADRDWIEIMELFATSPHGDDEVGVFEAQQMLGDRPGV